jgi:hypothetical protein
VYWKTGAGVQLKLEEQPDANTITHAPQPEMRRAVGEAMSQRRDVSLAVDLADRPTTLDRLAQAYSRGGWVRKPFDNSAWLV